MDNKRVEKNEYYLSIAEAVAGRGTCLRKNYGCIIVKNDEIIATGYTGAPRGRQNCIDLRILYKKKDTSRYETSEDMMHVGQYMQNKMQ